MSEQTGQISQLPTGWLPWQPTVQSWFPSFYTSFNSVIELFCSRTRRIDSSLRNHLHRERLFQLGNVAVIDSVESGMKTAEVEWWKAEQKRRNLKSKNGSWRCERIFFTSWKLEITINCVRMYQLIFIETTRKIIRLVTTILTLPATWRMRTC